MLGGVYLLLGLLYRGPRDMAEVCAVMRGVPIFPSMSIAAGNPLTQRSLAIPLYLVHLQGVKRTEAVLVQAPAQRERILQWYKTMSRRQGWLLADQETLTQGMRFLFTRRHEALQLIVSPTRQTHTQVQLIYLDGITERQRQLLIENPS